MSRSSTSLVLAVVALLTALVAGAANGATTNSSPSTQAMRALALRGQALNQTYHLGQSAGPSKQAIRALTLRGQALNQTYHLGQFGDRTGSSFAWVTAAFVAAAAFVLILAAFAGAVGVRRRRAVIAV